jgi:hypothetical protein
MAQDVARRLLPVDLPYIQVLVNTMTDMSSVPKDVANETAILMGKGKLFSMEA